MSLKLITAPTFEPVTLAEAKSHCRVDTSDDDTLLEGLIKATRQYLDGQTGWLNRALCTQTWDLYLDAFPSAEIRIPLPPLQSVTHVKYDDVNGVEQTVSSTDYDVDKVDGLSPGYVVPASSFSWPTTYDAINAVRVRFVAGWATDGGSPAVAQTPWPIKHAIKMMVSDMYENRESVVIGTISSRVPVATAVENLLLPWWVPSFG